MTAMIKDYRLTVKVRNNRILKAIEDTGATPGQKWCDVNNLGYARVNAFINMTSSPISVDGTLYPDAERLCEVLGKLPEELWSNEQLYPLERNFSEMEMDYAQVAAMLPPEQQTYLMDTTKLEQEQARCLIERALATISDQERMILKMRFEDDLTLREISNRIDLSIESARHIENAALRKLRHPKRAALLVDLLDEDTRRHKLKTD